MGKMEMMLWLGSSVDESIILILQGCSFDSHRNQELPNECINKWNNKSMFLSPFFSFSLKNQLKNGYDALWPTFCILAMNTYLSLIEVCVFQVA